MDINAKNVKDFIKQLTEKRNEIHTNLGKGIAQSCAVIEREAKESMTNTALNYDVAYYTHNKTKAHHPSQEGQPPAVDTGTLRRSITYTVDEEKLEGRVGTVINNPPYGAYLEFAEYGTSKTKPHPWLRPATEKSKEQIRQILARAMKK